MKAAQLANMPLQCNARICNRMGCLYQWQCIIGNSHSQLCSVSKTVEQVPGQAHSFVEHIQEGVAQAEADTTALLLFSGGQTRKEAGPRSEAEGYWLVAEAAGWWGHTHIRERTFTKVHLAAASVTWSLLLLTISLCPSVR